MSGFNFAPSKSKSFTTSHVISWVQVVPHLGYVITQTSSGRTLKSLTRAPNFSKRGVIAVCFAGHSLSTGTGPVYNTSIRSPVVCVLTFRCKSLGKSLTSNLGTALRRSPAMASVFTALVAATDKMVRSAPSEHVCRHLPIQFELICAHSIAIETLYCDKNNNEVRIR